MSQSRGNFNSFKKFRIPKGGVTYPLDVTGQFFECKESSHPFEMSFQDGEFFRWEKGRAFELQEQVTRWAFRSLPEFADDTIIQIYIGSARIRISRPFVTQEAGPTVASGTYPDGIGADGVAISGSVDLTNANPKLLLPGVINDGVLTYRAKAIFSMSTTGRAFIADADDNPILTLSDGDAADTITPPIETSDDLKILRNDGDVTVYYLQTFYKVPQ